MYVDLQPSNDLEERQIAIETRAEGYCEFTWHYYIPKYHVSEHGIKDSFMGR